MISSVVAQPSLLKYSELLDSPTSLELFAGTGGLALGVHAAKYRHLALVEQNAFAVETLRDNSRWVLEMDPNRVLQGDAAAIDYEPFADKVDLLTGGPPCQPFSTAGRNGGSADRRNMFPVFFQAMETIRPKAVLIENVRGLLRAAFAEYFAYILKRLEFPHHCMKPGEDWPQHLQRLRMVKERQFAQNEQYRVTYQLVDTADYGIPQRRERVIISAFRKDLGLVPIHVPPTHSRDTLLIEQWITGAYWERYGIEPADYKTVKEENRVAILRNQLTLLDSRSPWRTVRDALKGLPEPVERGEDEIVPNHVQHPGARVYAKHNGSVWDYPAKALKAGTNGTPGGENVLRVNLDGDVRYFTTREAARLHTFPDSWHFHGTWGACIKQLGNAVPVEMARVFADEIRQRLESVEKPEARKEENGQVCCRHHATSAHSDGSGRDRIQALAVHSGVD